MGVARETRAAGGHPSVRFVLAGSCLFPATKSQARTAIMAELSSSSPAAGDRNEVPRLRTGLRHTVAQIVELLNDLDGLERADPPSITVAETVDGQFCGGWQDDAEWLGSHEPHPSRQDALHCAETPLQCRTPTSKTRVS